MSLNKIFVTFVMLFSMLGFSNVVLAEAAKHKAAPEVLQEVDAKIQTALDAIASGSNAEEVTALINEVKDTASELSANYKFEFEKDKVIANLTKARKLSKKSDLSGAEQLLIKAREGFANLKNFL